MSAEFEALACELIRTQVRQLVRRPPFAAQDRDDLEQELWCHLWERRAKFTPEQARSGAFLTVVLRRWAANLRRDRWAQYRRHGHVHSLQEPSAGHLHGEPDLAAVVGRPEYDARRGFRSPDDHAQFEQAHDLGAVLRTASDTAYTVAHLLRQGSIAEVARQLGVPRTSLYQVLRQLRERFERGNLRDYLRNPPSPRSGTV